MSFALASAICIGLNLTIQSVKVFLIKPLDKRTLMTRHQEGRQGLVGNQSPCMA